LIWNSRIPSSLNDGPAWAGRGLTASVAGGISAQLGRIHANLVPQLWRTQNLPFAIVPGGDTTRNGFASPWQTGPQSADLPIRFGYKPTAVIEVGESAVWFDHSGLAAGVSTESQWWGPGIRNALIMSNNAGGIPHAFLRTANPVRTRLGTLEGRWIIGQLTESRFFDSDPGNDARSLSGAVVTLSPAFEPAFTVGVARVVYANVSGAGALPPRALDVFRGWHPRRDSVSRRTGAPEQLMSVFARYVLPASAAEVYGEWGRILLPVSMRSLLIAPQFTQGFTLGVQWAPEVTPVARVRIQAEVTNLEQSPPSRAADTLSFYASSLVPQGYTQRGQVIGAAIGPGSSSQWLALDWLQAGRSAGVFMGRIRWNTDAYYLQPIGQVESADVSVFLGVRGDARVLGRNLAAEVWLQRRLNFLFQNAAYGYSTSGTFDQRNITTALRIY
jgi:hypothetical protein